MATHPMLQPGRAVTLNPEQQAIVELPRQSAVQVLAGAGTGKTELIAHRFLYLLDTLRTETPAVTIDGSQIDSETCSEERILVATFTEKAAREMRERINRRLIEQGRPPLPESAWIQTFHQACIRILQAHPSAVGLSAGFEILGPLPQHLMMLQLVEDLQQGRLGDIGPILSEFGLAGMLAPSILSLESLQTLGVESPQDILERLPGVIRRIKATGLSPAEFCQVAHAQSRQFLQGLMNLPLVEPLTGEPLPDIQSYCQAWRRHLSPWASPHWNPLAIEHAVPGLAESSDTKAYQTAVGFLYDSGLFLTKHKKQYCPVSPQDFSALEAETALEETLIYLITAAYAVYQVRLKARNSCDFDDCINHAVFLLSQRADLRAYYQKRFEAIIVDEFQDSNPAQLRLLQLLIRPDAPNITVVGDDKQSIYGFRFAQQENLQLVFQDLPHQTRALQRNYRSTAPILAVANQLAEQLTGDPAHRLISGMPAPEGDPPAAPVVWRTFGTPVSQSTAGGESRPKAEPIEAIYEREANWIGRQIQALADSGDFNYGEIAVLTRNHRKARRIFDTLQQAGIPAIRQKESGFFEEPLVQTLLASLHAVVDPHQDWAITGLLASQLSQAQIFTLAQQGRQSGLSLFAQLGQPLPATWPPPLCQALAALAEVLGECHAKAPYQRAPNLAREVLARLGYWPEDPQSAPPADPLTDRLIALIDAVAAESPGFAGLATVLDTIGHYRDFGIDLPADDTPALQENAVSVLTIHSAKGLEFPVVFVAYAGSDRSSQAGPDSTLIVEPQFAGKAGFGLILGKHQGENTLKKEVFRHIWQKPREQREAQRLFYVALTRAQQRLFVSRACQSPEWTAAERFPRDFIHSQNEADERSDANPTALP